MADEDRKKLIKAITRRLADAIFGQSQENLIANGSIDTGYLLRSGEIIDMNEITEIFYKAPYAGVIEFGAKPHRINPDVLKPWIRRKLKVKKETEVNRIAFAIAQSIRQHGMKPRSYLGKAVDQIRPKHIR